MPLAGWQPDPYRRYELRHFDGERWTKHVRSGALTGEDLVEKQRPPPLASLTPKQRRAVYRKRAVWIAAVVAAASILVLLLDPPTECERLRDRAQEAETEWRGADATGDAQAETLGEIHLNAKTQAIIAGCYVD